MSKEFQTTTSNTFRKSRLAGLIPLLIAVTACGGSEGDVSAILADDGTVPTADVSIRMDLPLRISNLNEAVIVESTVSGQTNVLSAGNGQEFVGNFQLPFNVEHTIHLSVRRQSDNLLLGTARQQQFTSNAALNVYFPENEVNTGIDSDGDGFSNIRELEDGSDPFGRNGDYDGDGTPDVVDNDDDNDGTIDSADAFPYNATETVDTDLDGTGDNADPDDDNDGVDDNLDSFPRDVTESVDTDGDGIGNNADTDDDNDGIADINDINPLDAQSAFDTDGDGVGDAIDNDDDNDGVNDINDRFPLDDSESLDTDNDGIGNNADTDDDNDNTHDLGDPQPLNPDITGREDADSDGVPDIEDAFPLDRYESVDQDGDGIGNNADDDDDGNGIPDRLEDALVVIPRTTVTPTLDGIYGWREWSDSVHCDNQGNYTSANQLLIDNDGDESEGGRWGWSWRAMHDGSYLYLLIKAKDEPFYERFTDSSDAWHDDSVEIYLDIGNEAAQTYDNNDFQKVITFDGRSNQGSASASDMRVSFGTSMIEDSTSTDPAQRNVGYYEVRIDMSSIGLTPNNMFGLDIQINDDDNGGERDSKWAWYAPSGVDESWFNPSLFGKAILTP